MPSERVEAARKAYGKHDLDAVKEAHSHEAFTNERHSEAGTGEYVGNMVYGALDGIVTTFAIVAGAAGAGLSPGVVIVLGFANMFADGLSMAVGNYLSMKSLQSYYQAEKQREEWEVENYPEGEKEEIRQIYSRKGFTGQNLEKLVELVTSRKTMWIDTMMTDELGLVPDNKSPVAAMTYTFFSFVIAGFLPLLIFVVSYFHKLPASVTYPVSFLLTFATIFSVGSLRSLVIAKDWLTAGMEMLLIGGATALVSYGIGTVLGHLVL